FSYSFTAHLDLHSFPTRRSSDLSMMKVDVLALGMLTCIRKCFDLIADHKGRRYVLADIKSEDDNEVYQMLQRGDSLGVFQVESRDRKSTRLNSSHLVISYAVFCL